MQPTTDPEEYPKIKLGTEEHELKFRLSDMVRLQKDHQIDLFIPAEVKGVAALERIATVISAGLAHTGRGITPELVMDSIELGDLPIYALAVAEAQKKASPESQKALKALQDMTPKPETKKPNGAVQ